MRMGPLEAAARGVGGAGGKGRGGRGLGVSARKVQFTPSCDVGAGVGSGAKKSQTCEAGRRQFPVWEKGIGKCKCKCVGGALVGEEALREDDDVARGERRM